MKYQIIRSSYIDEKGNEYYPTFLVKYQTTKLWGYYTYWKYHTHLVQAGLTDCKNEPVTWDTKEEALDFAVNVLCKKQISDGWTEKIVHCGNCEDNKQRTIIVKKL